MYRVGPYTFLDRFELLELRDIFLVNLITNVLWTKIL